MVLVMAPATEVDLVVVVDMEGTVSLYIKTPQDTPPHPPLATPLHTPPPPHHHRHHHQGVTLLHTSHHRHQEATLLHSQTLVTIRSEVCQPRLHHLTRILAGESPTSLSLSPTESSIKLLCFLI